MAVTVITEESDKSQQTPNENTSDQNDKTLEMNMAAQFGAMTESNRQLQVKLSDLEMKYEQALASGNASRSHLESLQQRMDDLIARLETPDEEEQERAEPVVPPSISEPVTEKPEKKKSLWDTILYG